MLFTRYRSTVVIVEHIFLGKKLIEVSSDGAIFADSNLSNCLSKVEIKCPFPPTQDEMYKADVYYKLPKYYVLQVLAEMAAEPVSDNCLSICYSPRSTVVMQVIFDADLWREVMNQVTEIYSSEKEDLKAPKVKSPFIKMRLPELLDDFVSKNVRLVCEVPTVAADDDTERAQINEDMSWPYCFPTNNVDDQQLRYKIEDFKSLFGKVEDTIKLAYELCRLQAQEPQKPISYPIAYGLKGGKFDLEAKRRYFDYIMDSLTQKGYNVTCTVFDGEWAPMLFNDKNGEPLTLCALQRKLYRKVKAKKKEQLIKTLSSINNIKNLELRQYAQKNDSAIVVKGLFMIQHRTQPNVTQPKRNPKAPTVNPANKTANNVRQVKRRKKVHQPAKLIACCKRIIASSKISKATLNIVLSELLWPQALSAWIKRSCISHTMGEPFPSPWFSIPEFDRKRCRIEPKLWDGTHLLTNFRRVVCDKGTEYLNKAAWLDVAKTNKTKLKEPMVTDLIDKQAIEFAKTTFGDDVSAKMILLGYVEEAKFCSLLINWWTAEDEPGISAMKRFEYRMALRDYLLDGIDFGKFPPHGSHIKGKNFNEIGCFTHI